MTNIEMVWLARRLPPSVINEVCADAREAAEFWEDLPLPKQHRIAAEVVMVELALISRGALRALKRSPA